MKLPILPGMVDAEFGERPTLMADRIGRAYSKSVSAAHKKQWGQYLTPVAVADFMASQLDLSKEEIRILDPGAGSGVLACAVVEVALRQEEKPRRIQVDAFEPDGELAQFLDVVLEGLQVRATAAGVDWEHHVAVDDFVLRHAGKLSPERTLFSTDSSPVEYDVIIANPPYFKLPKSDPRARAAAHVVHGQPNIYGLFMAIAAALLAPGGELVFITPRSFTSGVYFRRFREKFFHRVQPERIHVFESRRDAFSRDGILQENIILHARRNDGWSQRRDDPLVCLSSSPGAEDLVTASRRNVRLSSLLDMTSREKMLSVPATEGDEQTIRRIDAWTGSLRGYGLDISTGPIVPFRATQWLAPCGVVPDTHVPLLWLQNVRPMRIEWPVGARGKQQYFCRAPKAAQALLLPDRNYVVLRRFSSKEERRRLVAAPLLAGSLGARWIGIENHLNYIHRPGGELTIDEAVGLAALYNCPFMDTYFRAINGSTQVGATEIRRIPLPPLELIRVFGRQMLKDPHYPVNPAELETLGTG